MAHPDVMLETRDLTISFGGLVAVNQVSLRVRRGEFKSVIGPNGAGKTTLFNIISGVYRPTSGRVLFKGEDVTGLPAYQLSRRGMGRSFQITNIFPNLTVLENIRLAAQSRHSVGGRLLTPAGRFSEFTDRAAAVAARVKLGGKEQLTASALPHGDKRKLEMAMLLATDPELLLLDEPTAGVSREEMPAILEVIDQIRDDPGKTVMLVEHKIEMIMSISDTVAVLRDGQLIADGPPQAVAADPAVQQAYLGGLSA